MGCTCGSSTAQGSPEQYLSCAGIGIIDNTPDEQLAQFAAQAGANANNFTMCYTVACLKIHRIIYWKNQNGDCGSQSSIQVSPILSTTKVAAGAAGSGIGIASGFGVSSIAGVSTATLGAATAGIGLVLAPILAITAHHAAAVANEQKTLCDVMLAFNQAATQIEQAVKSGQVTVQQANAAIQSVIQQVAGYAQAIAKPNTAPNAATGVLIAMNAIAFYSAAVVYPQIAPVVNVPGLSGVSNALGVSQNGLLLLGGGGLVAAKAAGAF